MSDLLGSALPTFEQQREDARRRRVEASIQAADRQLHRLRVAGSGGPAPYLASATAPSSHIRAAYVERDELLRFVRSLLTLHFDGQSCDGGDNCEHDATPDFDPSEPHEWSVREEDEAMGYRDLCSAAAVLLFELGLSEVERDLPLILADPS